MMIKGIYHGKYQATYTILTEPNVAYSTYSTLGFRHVNTYIEVEFDVRHFPRFAYRRIIILSLIDNGLLLRYNLVISNQPNPKKLVIL